MTLSSTKNEKMTLPYFPPVALSINTVPKLKTFFNGSKYVSKHDHWHNPACNSKNMPPLF